MMGSTRKASRSFTSGKWCTSSTSRVSPLPHPVVRPPASALFFHAESPPHVPQTSVRCSPSPPAATARRLEVWGSSTSSCSERVTIRCSSRMHTPASTYSPYPPTPRAASCGTASPLRSVTARALDCSSCRRPVCHD